MKKLNKGQIETKNKLTGELEEAAEKVTQAIEAANEAIKAYNDKLSDARDFKEGIVGDMESYYDEKSDRWREGDAGSNYEGWKSDWDAADFDDIEEIEAPSLDHNSTLETLLEEPDY